MRDDCIAEVENALGRALRRGESKEIEDAVNLHMRLLAREDPEAWAALSPYERLQQAAQAAAKAMTEAVRLKQERVRLQIAAHDRIENTLNDAFQALPDNFKAGAMLRVVSNLLAFDTKGKGITSVETWAKAIQHDAFSRLMPLWNAAKGFAGLFENPEGRTALVRELFGEESGNAAAKAGADAWRQVTDELRDRANAAGMNIGKLDEWHYPQSHSQGRIAKAGLEKWTEDTLPLLDRDKYIRTDGRRMSDDEVREFLRNAYDTVITDGFNKVRPGEGRGYGSVANRQSAHRQIFFKDADSYLTYQGEYGDRNLWSVLVGHVNAISRDIALTETLGPNAEKTFRYFNDRTRLDELRMQPTAATKVNKAATFNESLYDTVSGRTKVVNQRVADWGQSFRNWEVATKLGKVVLTALGDEAGMSATAFANRIPWAQVFAREFKYLSPGRAEDRSVAAHAGLGLNTLIGGLNRFGTEDFNLGRGLGSAAGTREFTSKLANGVLKASGAETMWDARRRALGSVLMSYLGKWTREVESFSDLNAGDHGILTRKGVTESDWKVWKLAQPEDWGMAHGVLTPKAVRDIPDEQLRELGNPEALRRHASTMLLGHVLEETGMGVMDTGARERTRAMYGTQAGTIAGELWRSAMLFKGFSMSMMLKHWARAGVMPTASDTAMYATRLIVMGTVMGALANQLRNVVAGKDPDNLASPRFWGSAVLRGGGLGFYGDFMYAEMTQHDTTLTPALMGPLYTEIESVGNLTLGNAFKAARGERTDEGAKLLRYARGSIPFLNMWYTQAAVDHLLWNDMQEAASPGYLERMQAKAEAQRGTSYYWRPEEARPDRAPDISLAHLWDTERAARETQQMARNVGIE
jgi:hypothetical protein